MGRHAQRLKKSGPILGATLAAGLAAVIAFTLLKSRPDGSSADGVEKQRMTVQAGPFSISAHFTGVVVSGEPQIVVSAAEGVLSALEVAYGERVSEGDTLAVLDQAGLSRQRAEARAALLRAEAAAERMEEWDQSAEMRRAERAVEAAQLDLDDLERRRAETAMLFERGLIARNEHEGLLQQLEAQRRALAQARDELEQVRRQGEGSQRRIASLELQAARSRLDALDPGGDGRIASPSDGVFIRAPGQAEDEDLHVGARISAGRVLGAVAQDDQFAVMFQIDEGDLDVIRPGQRAVITGPAFAGAVTGAVERVSGEADRSAGDGKARFDVEARLDPASSGTSRLRIGMTANVEVVTHEASETIAIPSTALCENGSSRWVNVVATDDGETERAPVNVGRAGSDRVEIVSGLKSDDVVVWPC